MTLQRFNTDPDRPHREAYFTLVGDEISKILDLAVLVRTAIFEGPHKVRLGPHDLDSFGLTPEAVRALLRTDPKLLAKLAEDEVTDRDVVALAYRRRQLDRFSRLLTDPAFFANEKQALSGKGDEQLWQRFFEANPWIFGYGLFYVFTSSFDEQRLEQAVAGNSIGGSGKRVDALLKTRGRISSLCFAEIKTHTTNLLEQNQYRPEVWAPSRELSGAVAQIQKTVNRAEHTLGERLDFKTENGVPTGETAFLVRPRSIVVVGNLAEFKTQHGINEPKFASFELFRRQLAAPEILTFDELYERARFIVESAAGETHAG